MQEKSYSKKSYSDNTLEEESIILLEWDSLKKHLEKIDILILNHGIYDLSRESSNYENSIEINALSKFKFLNLFEDIALTNESLIKKEIWINTSEAEILPALNPSYEISKSLIGQLISFKKIFKYSIYYSFIRKKYTLFPD